jgi:hypothetical protein
MAKNIIRLTESDLHRIVKESVNRILNEEVDMGQLDAMKLEPTHFEYPMEVKREIRNLRYQIDDLWSQGKDTTELENRLKSLKRRYAPKY